MLRALLLGAALTLLGCGDRSATPPADLAQPIFDLSTPGQHCGASVCMGSCTVCVDFAGGVCAIPCNTAMPASCPSGRCAAATNVDGGIGAGDGVHFNGNCGAYNGFCS